MAKHRITSARKLNLAKLALGAVAAASVLGTHAAVSAADDTATAAATHATAQTATVAQVNDGQAAAKDAKAPVTAAKVLATAKAQVGTSEDANGGGTKFQKWYAASERGAQTAQRDGSSTNDYLNAPWCAMFVSWVGEQSGATPQVGWDAYTVSYAQWFENNAHWGTQAKPGAVVFYSWSGSKSINDIQHVGLVVKDNHDGTISTVEGNTGNGKVEERVRPTSQVVGYGYPSYAA
jgi:hypothetical protein